MSLLCVPLPYRSPYRSHSRSHLPSGHRAPYTLHFPLSLASSHSFPSQSSVLGPHTLAPESPIFLSTWSPANTPLDGLPHCLCVVSGAHLQPISQGWTIPPTGDTSTYRSRVDRARGMVCAAAAQDDLLTGIRARAAGTQAAGSPWPSRMI